MPKSVALLLAAGERKIALKGANLACAITPAMSSMLVKWMSKLKKINTKVKETEGEM